jgi:hypothetical protein
MRTLMHRVAGLPKSVKLSGNIVLRNKEQA